MLAEYINAVESVMKQNATLKRLLKLAMEDMKNISSACCDFEEELCTKIHPIDGCNCFKWHYAYEAKEVLNNETD